VRIVTSKIGETVAFLLKESYKNGKRYMVFGKTTLSDNFRKIFETQKLDVSQLQSVHGGDINDAYCVYTQTGKYFMKINHARKYPEMFAKEAQGLQALRNNSQFTVPRVIVHGVSDADQYLILEWIEQGQPRKDFALHFGRNLAAMHQLQQPYFGFETDNYIGSLPQVNTQHASWNTFYAQCRILPLVKILADQEAFSGADVKKAERFCERLSEIFPEEAPALLHGDLWSGNYCVTADGYAAIYDPAVYYGHREMDLGMTLLFGGFPRAFYEAYHEYYPLEPNWRKRVAYTQLYPLLVHAILFGGHYVHAVRETLSDF